jgi:WhiB family redox-sensing transcriptional regulator
MYSETRESQRDTSGDWRNKAACVTVDPELFFPVGSSGPSIDQINKAKKVCARCSVRDQCLDYALETNQDSGIWGGLTEDERRAMKRRARQNRNFGKAATRGY